jgi:ATP-dependent Lhr-like helicase
MPERFSDITRSWFEQSFAGPTEIQARGWQTIATGRHALLVAPTGSGKTLAAFLAGIDTCASLPPDSPPGVRVIYISPLKALVYDVERNLRAPLVGIQRTAERLSRPLRQVRVDVRTGDTPQRERQRQAKEPAEILVTTPESLFLILGSRAREGLRSVHTVIVDEIHALAPSKRGLHLALSLERLAELTERDPQRIGLSATVRPLEEMARFLGGDRPVEIVDASAPPRLDLAVTVPVPDMDNPRPAAPPRPGGSILGELYAREVGTPATERGIWPAIYPELLELIRERRSTIVFVNSRGLCERLTQRLNELAGEELVRAHHGSVSHETRAEIEEGLKQGRIRGIVATSSLELGIDMGAVDLVALVESPGSVARGLQRVGRAGHQVDTVSVGRIFPKFKADLLEATVVATRMLRGELESLRVPRNALDVLAQQIVAMCSVEPRRIDELERVVRRSYPYRELGRSALEAVLDMLSGRYPSQDFADLRPLLAWDRASDLLSPRRGAAMTVRLNAGTIPDRGNYAVVLGPEGPRLGELDEEMVFETRTGENILLGASTWRVEEVTRDRVIVSPAPGEPGKLPFWHGDGPGRPIELGRALGAFVRELGALGREDALEWLRANTPLDPFAAGNLLDYVVAQREHTGTLPTDRAITVERFRDELGDWRVCILTPFGARVHAPWAMALQQTLSVGSGFEVQAMYTDDGIVLRFADTDDLPDLSALLPDPDEVEELVTDQLGHSALFAGLFRENAARSLLLPRRRADQRSPLWAQRLKSQELQATVRRYASFPVVLETYRQALSDVFDLAAFKQLLRDVRGRRLRVEEVETRSASPFARSLVFAYVAAYIYEQDAPLAERKAQALTLDRNLLSELLGQAELRELLDADVLAGLERELQHLTEQRKARDADQLHDLLRHLGDLDEDELTERSTTMIAPWLASLEQQRRAAAVQVAGVRRWIAAEDAALYRDALGVAPPPGLPQAFLDASERPFEQIVRRYARSHGPFTVEQVAHRYGLLAAQLEPVLLGLEREGLLVRGEIRPGGAALDWCDTEVLRRLKRRTLARLRHEVAPVEAAALGSFLPQWQGLGDTRQGPQRLLEVLDQLEGLSLPWSELHTTILPARVTGFQLDMLDMLAATGQVVWVGDGPLGARDGRIRLFHRARVGQLLIPPAPLEESTPLHEALLEELTGQGASFLFELEEGVRRALGEVAAEELEAALWDLVWAGLITNDTFAPLRSLGRPRPRSARARWRPGQSLAGGRWSLVSPLIDPQVSDTERTVARAETLLQRYGIVSREAAIAEDLPGGFGPLYRVLQAMEEAGRIRRGYFVEGLSGAQFARAGAVDRLRTARPPIDADPRDLGKEDLHVLPAIDPANPFGTLLPWPESGAGEATRPRRVPGAWVVLVQGRALIYLGPGGRQLLTFPTLIRDTHELELAVQVLHGLPRGARRRSLVIEKIDGVPVRESIHFELMRRSGFENEYRGMAAGFNTVSAS